MTRNSPSEEFEKLRRLHENILGFTNLCYLIKKNSSCFFFWHVVKLGTAKHGTAERGMPEQLIRNGKTRNTKSRTPIYGTVLSDEISKPGRVKTQDTGHLQEVF